MSLKLKLPDYAEECINVLEKNGYEAFAVGGCVRDSIIGTTPHDYDVTTNALPSEVKKIFPHVIPTGEKFGTLTVLFGKEQIEVTTYRFDGEYDDFRRPSKIQFGKSLKEDLARRDFTVNAIAYSPKVGLVDLFGGMGDIKNKIIRTVGEPEKRFSEDALRIMRCFRFSAQLGFEIDGKTRNGALALIGLLEKISVERIRDELFKIICSKNPKNAEILIKSGGLEFLGIGKEIKCSLNILALLPDIADFKLGAFLYITNSKDCSRRLKLSNKQLETAEACYELLDSDLPKTKSELKKLMSTKGSFDYNNFLTVYSVIHRTDIEVQRVFYNEIISNNEPYKISMLKINGSDLKELGITDGVKIGKILNYLCNEVINEPKFNTKHSLITLVNKADF